MFGLYGDLMNVEEYEVASPVQLISETTMVTIDCNAGGQRKHKQLGGEQEGAKELGS